ncbi:MAG: DUF1003 domain-containing protein [Candidatus Roizmanbacteria bacterium]
MDTLNWHKKHTSTLTVGQRIADKVAMIMGSWSFIIIQTAIVSLWIGLNVAAYANHWDPYPFILLNLLFSTQAAYAAPIIMMAQNRQEARDRIQAEDDYRTNVEAKKEIEDLQKMLARIENEKLDKILKIVSEK